MAVIPNLTNYTLSQIVSDLGQALGPAVTTQTMYNNRPNKNIIPNANPSVAGDTCRGWEGYDTVGWGAWSSTGTYRCVGTDRQLQYKRTSGSGLTEYEWRHYQSNSPLCVVVFRNKVLRYSVYNATSGTVYFQGTPISRGSTNSGSMTTSGSTSANEYWQLSFSGGSLSYPGDYTFRSLSGSSGSLYPADNGNSDLSISFTIY